MARHDFGRDPLTVDLGDGFDLQVLAATTRGGKPSAAMDLLIATAALLDDAPLVTRNVKDFSRMPGLRVLRY